jgi:hypothetical protein
MRLTLRGNSFLLAGIALMAVGSEVAPTFAQNEPFKTPPTGRPGAIPMFMPRLYPQKPDTSLPPRQPVVTNPGQVWIYPQLPVANHTIVVLGGGGTFFQDNSFWGSPGFGATNGSVAPVVTNNQNGVQLNETVALRQAFTGIASAWEENNFAAIRPYLDPNLSVAISQGEQYRNTLRPQEFRAYLVNWLGQVDTSSFRFANVRYGANGVVYAYANHRYRTNGDRRLRSATVSYTLTYLDGGWRIVGISLPAGIALPITP